MKSTTSSPDVRNMSKKIMLVVWSSRWIRVGCDASICNRTFSRCWMMKSVWSRRQSLPLELCVPLAVVWSLYTDSVASIDELVFDRCSKLMASSTQKHQTRKFNPHCISQSKQGVCFAKELSSWSPMSLPSMQSYRWGLSYEWLNNLIANATIANKWDLFLVESEGESPQTLLWSSGFCTDWFHTRTLQ